MNPKQRAAEAALKYVESGMVVGLGTGSTADQFLQALARAIAAGKLTGIRGVPTSLQSERRARDLGIPLSTLAETPRCDVTIDGADEVDPNLDLIKGLGGALLREKVVAQNSAKLVIIADAGKVVERLGLRAMLPVEVARFAHEAHVPYLRGLGAEPEAVPDLALQVLGCAEQRALAVAGDHQPGVRLGESGEVVEVAVVPVEEVAVPVARALGRGGHQGDALRAELGGDARAALGVVGCAAH